MGGRGAIGRSRSNGGGNPFSIPKVTRALLSKMDRSRLETLAIGVYANNAMKNGISKSEGIYRAKSLMDGNSTAQLKQYILKHSK